MLLASDNVAGASPEIVSAVNRVANGDMPSYGEDEATKRLSHLFGEIFEHSCVVVPVGSGIASNALGLSLLVGPLEAAICHQHAHIYGSESGAFEMFTHGGKLLAVPGENAKITPDALEALLARIDVTRSATVPPRALTLTQGTELGTVYTPDEIARNAALAHRCGLRVHLDGARFANALVSLNCRPAELTWQAGVDVLSFGASKNGTMTAEALVIFDPVLSATLDQRRRRSGQLISKMRFLSVQLESYFANDLWLHNARLANALAKRLAAGLATLDGFEILHPVEINLVFVRIAETMRRHLDARGIQFRRSNAKAAPEPVFRLVPSYATTDDEITTIIDACREASRTGKAS